VLFRTLDLSNLALGQLQRRLEHAPALGPHVRTLVLHPREEQHVPPAARLDPYLVQLLKHMPNIRHLSIYYHTNDYYGHPRLLTALASLAHLDQIDTRDHDALVKPDARRYDAGYGYGYGETPQAAVAKTWANVLVQHLLDRYPTRLRRVRLHGALPLHLAAFCKMRDRLSALAELELTMGLGLELRDAFAYQTRWRSAAGPGPGSLSGSLTRLVLRRCTGVHATVVANHVASGVFGALQFLTLVMCGHPSDDPHLALPPHNDDHAWWIPTMQRVEIDHADRWRVAALARLHTRELVLSRVPRETPLLVVQIERLFPGLETLSIPPTQGPEFLAELRRAATKRAITVTDDAPFCGDCACHRE
jgi:hypothetical protein